MSEADKPPRDVFKGLVKAWRLDGDPALTPDEIAEGLKVCEAAPEGPWWPLLGTDGTAHVLIGDQEDRVAECHAGETKPAAAATFIVLARTLLPRALRELRAERDRTAELEATVERLCSLPIATAAARRARRHLSLHTGMSADDGVAENAERIQFVLREAAKGTKP